MDSLARVSSQHHGGILPRLHQMGRYPTRSRGSSRSAGGVLHLSQTGIPTTPSAPPTQLAASAAPTRLPQHPACVQPTLSASVPYSTHEPCVGLSWLRHPCHRPHGTRSAHRAGCHPHPTSLPPLQPATFQLPRQHRRSTTVTDSVQSAGGREEHGS